MANSQLQEALLANTATTQEWLNDWFSMDWYMDLLKDFYFWVFQQIVDMATWCLSHAASAMPSFDIATDSVGSLNVDASAILGFLAWLFPFDALIFCLQIIVVNYVAYFTIGPFLRWVKII